MPTHTLDLGRDHPGKSIPVIYYRNNPSHSNIDDYHHCLRQ
ncbi:MULTISPECIES: hypothetical protein [unclassified Kosakonia]|nr:hypothetical protein [Kosakonia sp.]